MHDIPLNDTQRIFADKNHNLVYKFLHEKNLPASEYYDIVIFGYLRAVQRYLTDPNLAGYSFATVAWRAMEGEVVNTHPHRQAPFPRHPFCPSPTVLHRASDPAFPHRRSLTRKRCVKVRLHCFCTPSPSG